MENYYEILGVSRDAEQEVISAAYKALMRKYHPDVNKAASAKSRARAINEAFDTLKSFDRRQRYDAELDRKNQSGWAGPGHGYRHGQNSGSQQGGSDDYDHWSHARSKQDFDEFQTFKHFKEYEHFRRYMASQRRAEIWEIIKRGLNSIKEYWSFRNFTEQVQGRADRAAEPTKRVNEPNVQVSVIKPQFFKALIVFHGALFLGVLVLLKWV